MAYYALLLMAGTAYLKTNIKMLSCTYVFVLNVFIGVVAVLACGLIWLTHNDIVTNYRRRVIESHKRLSQEFQGAFKNKHGKDFDYDSYRAWTNGIEYPVGFSITLLLSGAALIWLVKPLLIVTSLY